MTPLILKDRTPVDIVEREYPALVDFLRLEEPSSIEGKETVHFCGIVCPPSQLPVMFLPRGSNTSDIRQAGLSMQAIARYGREVESRIGNAPTDGGQASLAALINEIAADFKRDGLFSQRIRVRHVGAGKPDWKRTLVRRIPMLTANGTPVYTVLDTTRGLDAYENPLAIIQAATVKNIARVHGWWTGLDEGIVAELAEVPRPALPEKFWSSMIRHFMQFLYDDHSLSLARLLVAYWDRENANSEGGFLCGVPDFSAIWEHMLRNLVRDTSAYWNGKLPIPGYIYRNGEQVMRNKGGVMDIVIEDTETVTVADAKYYAAYSTNTAPGFPDILKQSFYSSAIARLTPDKKIRSCFVFPASGDNARLEIATFFERSHSRPADWLMPTECLYIDMDRVMEEYVSRGRYNWHEAVSFGMEKGV